MRFYAVPLFLGVATMLEIIPRWLAKFDIDHEEGNCLPDRWVSWGWICDRGGNRMHRYLAVKLPLVRWTTHPFTGEEALLQRGLIRLFPWPGHFERPVWFWTNFPVKS